MVDKLVGTLGELLLRYVTHGGPSPARPWIEPDRALVVADLVVLAALWDDHISPDEQRILAEASRRLFVDTGLDVTTEELLARWEAVQGPRERALERLAAGLSADEREIAFHFVSRVLVAGRPALSPDGPYRASGQAAHGDPAVLRAFGRALRIDDAVVDALVASNTRRSWR